jgi:amino acid transporter
VTSEDPAAPIEGDEARLRRLGYSQELAREMGGFSNFALSLSIICILAGGITSFHLGFSAVGGAAIGLGWPLACLLSLAVAAAMAQIGSAYPTAGGLYHWASILGGRGWGWLVAWFNLAGLVTVLAAINVGTFRFAAGVLLPELGLGPDAIARASSPTSQAVVVGLMTASHAIINHRGIRLTARLTDFSGYLILVVSAVLTIAFLAAGWPPDPGRLVRFTNFSGTRGGGVWPATGSIPLLFALGLLLPAYTITGFDASAHAAEETRQASRNVPRGIVRSVWVSGLAGWVMLAAAVLAIPDMDEAAARGEGAFPWLLRAALPRTIGVLLTAGIVAAQYLCGLAAVTSASRMAFAFARDGGLPFSAQLRRVSPKYRTPATAIWVSSAAAVLFTLDTPVYSTITAVCTILLYVSYVLPCALGCLAYRRTWTEMGPWDLGGWFWPLSGVGVAYCAALIVIGMQPPNQRAAWVVGAFLGVLAVVWITWARHHFPGPAVLNADLGGPPAESP